MRRLRQLIGSRLFVKIYLTVLACLAAAAITSGIYWGRAIEDGQAGWRERRDLFIEQMLPASDSAELSRDIINRFARALSADISVYSPDRQLLISAGRRVPLPRNIPDDDDDDFDQRDSLVVKRLDDGRILAARFELPWRMPRRGPLGYVLLIAAVIGAAAYPVVRNLTRRLERLRVGVERFGGGDLVARVPVEGRDEIATVAKSFNKAADRIEGLVGAHRSLLANASHELRAPVTRLRMALELDDSVQDGPLRKEAIENLGEIDTLVEEILLASRLDHVGGLERAETIDLMALAAEEAARHGLEATGAPVEIKGDARLMTRLVRNLILNALRHGRAPVDVSVMRAGKLARISVRDHGEGLPKGEEGRVFEPFYRPSGRSEAAGGWGLGLALVRQIAELHGGEVRYKPADGGGASFVVDIPLNSTKRKIA